MGRATTPGNSVSCKPPKQTSDLKQRKSHYYIYVTGLYLTPGVSKRASMHVCAYHGMCMCAGANVCGRKTLCYS